MTTLNSNKICAGYEPIPGYTLEEAIGRGGFGEVWRCSAPGGLKKAIKFVFGNQDQSRATREVRSLERVKGVHHPFLLTLERFEIIDEQLVIITELAEGSLEDVFKRHRDNGSCGIPRETLLSYLNDTADGLDYLHQSYQLQHLDIKPGNLLIIGGHVKVADFGLLKDLRDIDCSVVGGLTPIYAPPEVFDGRPSLHSDQYSLAIMFQELLTGTRPFSGRTIAQLATQHVHSAPNLETLPPSDRPVIARALEKNPNRRFPSCKAFVEALRNHHGRNSASFARNQSTLCDPDDTKNGTIAGKSVEDLPQLKDNSAERTSTAAHHALVVAIGGSGAECIRELRRRIADMHVASPLDLHSVIIDTDMSTIHSIRLGEVSDRIPKCKIIYTPLKTAHEYRSAGTGRLSSISRRWIYNVPRSGSTEGMRPLGRLALVDHGDIVKERLAHSIETLIAESNGIPPKVYVVGSLAGGTGSGMYIDVVHLLRHLLDQAGLEETKILSLLTTVGFQFNQSNPIALHDAQAALNEIAFFMQVGNGYPGDEGAGWPSVPAARTPLHDLYVIAASPRDQLATNPIDSMVEYVWADSTGCGGLLSAARQIEGSENQSVRPPSIRSVGVVPLGSRHCMETRVLSPSLVQELLSRWLGLPSKAKKAAPLLADRLGRRLGLSWQHIVETLSEHFDHVALPAPTMGAIDSFVSGKSSSGEMDWVSGNWSNNLYREISVCLNDRRGDMSTVIASLNIIREQCIEWSRQAIMSLPTSDHPDDSEIPESVFKDAIVKRFAAAQIDQFVSNLTFLEERLERFAAILAVAIVEIKNEVGDANPWKSLPEGIRAQYNAILVELHGAAVGQSLVRPLNDLGANVDPRSLIGELSEAAVPIVIAVVEKHSSDLAISQTSGLSVEKINGTFAATFSEPSMQIGRTEGTQVFTRVSQPGVCSGPVSVDDAVIAVKPALLAMGGLQRVILVVGSEVERSQLEPELRALHAGALTVAVIPGADPKLIHEAQQIEMKNIISRLTALNGGNEQVTSRLASRVDVPF